MNSETKKTAMTMPLIGGPHDGDKKSVPLVNIKVGNILYFPFNGYITTYIMKIKNKKFVATYEGGYKK